MEDHGDDPVQAVVWMLRGGQVAMILRAGCRLGVFDEVLEPRTAAEVSTAVSGDPDAVVRLLRVLVDLGLVEHEDERYVATARGATLSSGHPAHACDLVLMQTDLPTIASWHDLESALRNGAGVYERVNQMSHWEYLSADPVAERVFNEAMARRGSVQVDMLLGSVDLEGVRTLVDVGGGRGAMLAGLLEALPDLTGVVADRPAVAKEATAFLAAAGLGDRGSGVGCDFFSSVPSGADVYTMAHVLHDWTDDDCLRILRTLQASMPRHARLLVIERVLGAPGRPPALERDLHLTDLHMLVMFGARERSRPEYDALLTAAGFTRSRLGGTGDWNVLEARPG